MGLTVGEIVTGKVTGITKFGAFVALDAKRTGLVHISEVSRSFVNDIHDHLTEGQEVKVKIIAVEENGRINLSIKKALPQESNRNHINSNTISGSSERPVQRRPRGNAPRRGTYAAQELKNEANSTSLSFEDKLKHFMQDSESRMSDIRHNMDRKSGSRRRK
ncbi:MAG: S1 RNA-binding domain-containing protein [Eubacteriales bacterium]|nr:S1 RNA-binding domain-containing protein [Eubacteriales bacterium]